MRDADEDEDELRAANNEPPNTGVSTAYQTYARSSLSGKFCLSFGLVMLVLMLFRIFSTNYEIETKTLLAQSGASQSAIDSIIPPTQRDVENAAIQRQSLLSSLATNMTAVQAEVSSLRREVELLKKSQTASNGQPPSYLRG